MNKTIYTDQEDLVFPFLDRLRESGVTNMFGAGTYVEDQFDLNRRDAGKLVIKWMTTFEDRHPNV
jgi:hypothetical protein